MTINKFAILLTIVASCLDTAQGVMVGSDNLANIAQQPSAQQPDFDAPIRNLTWGQLNIIHTTDTHGWLPGHLLEPNFSADWGDLYSFVTHLKEAGDKQGTDVLLVDTGDRHDGNGLSDATYPNAILTEKLFLYQDYDIITIGNHELYKYESALTDYMILGKHFKEKYVVSNVDILVNGTWKPMGNRYRRFTTKNQKLNVIGYGFLFNFFGSNPQNRVTFVQDAVKENWFQESLKYTDTDVFVVAAHIPIRFFPEIRIITNAIRKVHPNAVIQVLGGHSHIRDYVVIDKKATALESGRFMETVGWASIDNIDRSSSNSNVSFSREYINTNLHSYSRHTNTSLKKSDSTTFFTEKGLEISAKIKGMRKKLGLDDVYGCIPRDYLMNRARYPGPDSFYSLMETMILPRLIGSSVPISRSLVHPRFILINTGSVRFDLFKGPFTRDSGFIVSPFVNNWLYFPDVPLKYARKILPELNKLPYILSITSDDDLNSVNAKSGRISSPGLPPRSYLEMNIPQSQAMHYQLYNDYQDGHSKVPEQALLAQEKKPNKPNMGYVTCDDIGCDGDDTIQDGWTFFPNPNAVQAAQNIPSESDDNLIDVVFYDFLKPFLLDVLKKIDYHNDTILHYGGNTTVEMLTDFVLNVWSACE